ncbi:MAG TPA: hypothetical protein VIL92_06115 [Gaiellaceae bacterium]
MTIHDARADIPPVAEQLFTEPMPTARPLPRRQDVVLRAVIRLNGVTDDEAGALVHADRPPDHRYWHDEDTRCTWCGRDGRSVLRALQKKKLVCRRRDGTWTLPGGRARQEHERARADVADTTPPARSRSGPVPLAYNELPEGF